MRDYNIARLFRLNRIAYVRIGTIWVELILVGPQLRQWGVGSIRPKLYLFLTYAILLVGTGGYVVVPSLKATVRHIEEDPEVHRQQCR